MRLGSATFVAGLSGLLSFLPIFQACSLGRHQKEDQVMQGECADQ